MIFWTPGAPMPNKPQICKTRVVLWPCRRRGQGQSTCLLLNMCGVCPRSPKPPKNHWAKKQIRDPLEFSKTMICPMALAQSTPKPCVHMFLKRTLTGPNTSVQRSAAVYAFRPGPTRVTCRGRSLRRQFSSPPWSDGQRNSLPVRHPTLDHN